MGDSKAWSSVLPTEKDQASTPWENSILPPPHRFIKGDDHSATADPQEIKRIILYKTACHREIAMRENWKNVRHTKSFDANEWKKFFQDLNPMIGSSV